MTYETITWAANKDNSKKCINMSIKYADIITKNKTTAISHE
jgi:hypothetical protein